MESLLDQHNLIPTQELIRLALSEGLYLGSGEHSNYIRYLTKVGLLPPAKRLAYGGSYTVGHYPRSALQSLREISNLVRSGWTIQQIVEQGLPTDIPTTELINRARLQGIYVGNGDPYNYIRYLTKVGILPNARRQSVDGSANTVGHYPISALETLRDIDQELRSGKTIQQMAQEQASGSWFEQDLPRPEPIKPPLVIHDTSSQEDQSATRSNILSRFSGVNEVLFSKPVLATALLVMVLVYLFGKGGSLVGQLALNNSGGTTIFDAQTTYKQESQQNNRLTNLESIAQQLTLTAEDLTAQNGQIKDIAIEAKVAASTPLVSLDTTTENQIQNSSYELNSSGAPEAWQYLNLSDSTNTYVSQEASRTGNNSLKFIGLGLSFGGIKQSQTLTRPEVDPALSVWVKGTGLSSSGYIRLGLRDINGKNLAKQDFYLSGTFTWQRLTLSVLTGAGYPFLEFKGYTRGVAYLDDWQVTEGTLQIRYAQNNTLGQGSILASGHAELTPVLTNHGSLGTPTSRFGALFLTGVTIDNAGNTTISGTTTTANVQPAIDITYDIGTPTLRYRNIYAQTIFSSGTGFVGSDFTVAGNLTVNGTSHLIGNVTIDNNLFAPASGTVGYWSRSGTTLSPSNVGDNVTTSGNISTTGTGTITAAGLLTANGGITDTGNFSQTGTGTFSTGSGAVSLNGATTVTGANTFTVNSGLTTLGGNLTFSGTNPAISVSTAGNNLNLDAGTTGAVNIASTSTGDVNLAGGSGATGCTVTNSNGNFTCSGNIQGTGATLTGFTPGSVIFAGAGGALSQNNANFFWDNTNNRLGIGTTGPVDKLDVQFPGTRDFVVSAFGCGSGFAGIGFSTTVTGCTTFSVLGDGTNTFINRPSGGTLYFREANTTQVAILPVSGAANYLTLQAATAGNTPQISVAGTDSSINLNLAAKSNGDSVVLKSGTANAFVANSVASGANYLSTTGAIAGSSPSLSTVGGDTNIGFKIDAKGSGTVDIAGVSTGDVNLAGGSGATGCTVFNATGNFTCTGNITGSNNGTVGFWSRNSSTGVLSPATATDLISITPTLTTTTTAGFNNAVSLTGSGATSTYYGQKLSFTNTKTTNTDTTYGQYISFTDGGTLANTVTGLFVDATTANANDTTYSAVFQGGNVGIGTTAPSAKLQVVGGNILLDNTQAYQIKDDGGVARRVLDTASDGTVNLYGYHETNMVQGVNGATYFYSSGSSGIKMTILGSNVGIGNTVPANKLNVNSPSTADALATTLVATTVATNKGLVVQGFTSQSADLIQAQNSAGTAQFRVKSNGDVVVGATGGGKLTVGVVDPYLILNQGDVQAALEVRTTATAGADDIVFEPVGVEKLRIPETGNISITGGVTSSGQFLAANGSAAAPSYAFTNSTGTGLFRVGADILGFSTSGAQRLQIDASGNLTFAGATAVTLATSTTALNFQSGLLDLDTTNSRVGIGTTGPTAKLEVSGNVVLSGSATSPGLWVNGNYTAAAGTGYAVLSRGTLTAGANGDSLQSIATNLATVASGTFTGLTYYGAKIDLSGVTKTGTGTVDNTWGLRLDAATIGSNNYAATFSGGNVGIGTTTPGFKLEVVGQNVRLTSGGTTSLASYQLGRTVADVEFAVAGVAGNYFSSSVSGDIALKTSGGKLFLGANTADATVTLNTSGQVGIGNTSPANKLNVNSPSTADALATVLLATTAATNKGLVVQGFTSQSADLIQAQNSAGTAQFVVKSNGDVVIGSAGLGKLTVGVVDPYLITNQGTFQAALEFRTTTTAGADDIVFEPVGVEKLRIPETGNVSITGGLTTSSGQFLAANGTAAAPSYAFTNSTGTGLYRNGADVLAFATAGVNRGQFTATGQLTLSPASGSAYGLQIVPTANIDPIFAIIPTATDTLSNAAILLQVSGETGQRLRINKDGSIAFGSSTTASDITIARQSGPSLSITGGSVGIGTTSPVAGNGLTIAPAARTSGSPSLLTITAPADTTLANAEFNDVNWNLNRTATFTGSATPGAANITTQRAILFQAPTYAFGSTGAQTISNATTFAIGGIPLGGTNTTITNGAALRISANADSGVTNGYGLYIDAGTGATNNYAATFASGNVGINITSPGYPLDVSRSTGASYAARIDNSTAAGSSFGLLIDAGGNSTDTSLNVRDRAGGTSYLYVRGDGNVGVGTAGPLQKFHVASAGTNQTITSNFLSEITGTFTAANRVGLGSSLNFRNDTGVNYAQIAAYCPSDCTNNQSQLGFWTQNTSTAFTTSNAKMVIDNNGNVGIGTGAPAALLHVAGSGTGTTVESNLVARLSSPTTGRDVSLQFSDTVTNAAYISMLSGDLHISPAAAVSALVVKATTGNVGIGTTAPGSRLEVYNGIETQNRNTIKFTPELPPGAPTVAVNVTAGNLNGAYTYKITFVTTSGETQGGTTSATVSPVNQQVNLTAIPTGTSPFVTARKIYRTSAGGADGTQKLVTTLNDNTTTTYTDNIADGSLGATQPKFNTTASVTTTNSENVVLAHASGKSVAIFDPTGDVAGKITWGTADPLYNIGGVAYATYVASLNGVREEFTGSAQLTYDPAKGVYTYTIDLNNSAQGTDLWVFSRIIDPDVTLTDVLLTPSQPAKTWYGKDSVSRKIIFYSEKPVEVSYRLTAPRFDHLDWPTKSKDQQLAGLTPPDPQLPADNAASSLNEHLNSGAYNENYQTTDSSLETGDLVSIDPFKVTPSVTKTALAYDTRLAGVVTGRDAGVVSVAPAGRVAVKVSIEAGAVVAGDMLTSSATKPGYAMKATQVGRTLGLALQAASTDNTILVEVSPSWFDPAAATYNSNGTTTTQASTNTFDTLTAKEANITNLTVTKLSLGGVQILTDADGNIKVNGNIVVSGSGTFASLRVTGLLTLDGSISAPNGLAVALGAGKSFSVKDTTGSAKLTVTDQGDVLARTISVDAVKISTTSAQPTAGTVTITANSKQLTITNTKVTSSSQVLVTFKGDYKPATRYWISDIVDGTSFVLNLDAVPAVDVPLSYWIVN